ncbi:MAG TPA: hypothetical protein VMA13_02825 [Candidatus Saccharimonadales bacterium]|nr:hypothetical protein [Candidatus Saccharimonadales bacterium]
MIRTNAAATPSSPLPDELLDFGVMKMPWGGRAFLLGTNSPPVTVAKQWLTVSNRTVLVESVRLPAITASLSTLPAFSQTTLKPANGSPLYAVSTQRLPPPPGTARADFSPMKLARTLPPSQGYLLDYVILNGSDGDVTLQSDTTYDVTGTLTIEGGTCIKYDESGDFQNGGIVALGGVNCETSEYRSAIITSANDNSAGQTISGSSGHPSTYNCAALEFNVCLFDGPVEYLHVRYAEIGLNFEAAYSGLVRHCQFLNAGTGIQNYDSGAIPAENDLFAGVSTAVFDTGGVSGGSFAAAQVTIDNAIALATSQTPVDVTNSILSRVTSLGSNPTGDYNAFCPSTDPQFGSDVIPIPAGSSPFQTAGAGNYYVTNPNYQVGPLVNISASLLFDLEKMTTFPPTVVANKIISSVTPWPQTVSRESGTGPLMLGYHYPALDYLVSQVNVQSTTLTLGQGVAVGVYGSVGLLTYTASTLISQGTPVAHNQLCWYPAVQEQPESLGSGELMEWEGGDPPSVLNAQFTDFNGMSGMLGLVDGYDFQIQLINCYVGPGSFTPTQPPGCCYVDGITNNLFERATLDVGAFDYMSPVYFYNNTAINSTVEIDAFYGVSGYRTIEDNLFDNSTVNVAYPGYATYGYNAYSGGSTTLTPPGPGDFNLSTLVYDTGPLGNRYIDPSTSPTLIDAGYPDSGTMGLCHYTVQADQTMDSGPVDIGFHYYALSVPYPNGQWVMTGKNTPAAIRLTEGSCSSDISQNDTFTIVGSPSSGGSVTPTVGFGTVVYTPTNPNFEGEDDFDFNVSNPGGTYPSPAQVRVFVVAAPQLTATCLSDRIVLSWSIDSALQNLESPNSPYLQPFTDIYRYDSSGWHLIHTSTYSERLYSDTSVQPGVNYSYRIQLRYVDSWGNVSGTPYSNIQSISTCSVSTAGLITGNTIEYYSGSPIETYNMVDGSLVNSFTPDGSTSDQPYGFGVAISGTEIFYTQIDPDWTFSDAIHVCPYGTEGSGGHDTTTLPNPRPGAAIQALAFHSNELYVLTGYYGADDFATIKQPEVFELNPGNGSLIAGPIFIASPANGDSIGFAILPNGNFLIQDGSTQTSFFPPVYREYSATTGNLVTGGLVVNLTPFANTSPAGWGLSSGTPVGSGVAVAPDGQSLYFMVGAGAQFYGQLDTTTIIQTDLTGRLMNFQNIGNTGINDIDVVIPPQ